MNYASGRHFLKEREAINFLNQFSNKAKIDIKELMGPTLHIEVTETQTATIYFVNNKPLLALINSMLTPTLLFEKVLRLLPKIVVNMAAVPHICNGADVMAPGIIRIEKEFNTNEFVAVVDERHDKFVAITIALMDSQVARSLKYGKIAKNIHYVGDKLWDLINKLT
jgi:PUA domain protein